MWQGQGDRWTALMEEGELSSHGDEEITILTPLRLSSNIVLIIENVLMAW